MFIKRREEKQILYRWWEPIVSNVSNDSLCVPLVWATSIQSKKMNT